MAAPVNPIVSGFSEQIRAAAAAHEVLRIRGGGSKDFYGGAPRDQTRPAHLALEAGSYCGIVAYEPAELYLTARAGTLLTEIEAALAAQGQMLAAEPPHFSATATWGGMVAAGLSGPRRVSAGAVRDQVLGVRLLSGEGQMLKFGGQVMKNVAGFDVARLLAGSMGTLGLILEATLKVLPCPAATLSLRFELDQARAIHWVNQLAGKPWPLVASAWGAGQLTLRLAGAQAAVALARTELGGEALPPTTAETFWQHLREQQLPDFLAHPVVWRAALPSICPPLSAPSQWIEWHGAQRWLTGEFAWEKVHAEVRAAGGHLSCFRNPAGRAPLPELPPTLARLKEGVRAALDPLGVFDTGRI